MASKELEIVIKAKDQASGVLGKIGGAMGGLAKSVAAGAGIAVTGLGALAAGMTKLAIDAAPLQQLRAAFDGIAASAGTSGTEMLAALEKGSNGMIAQTDLMQSFNKAASLVSKDFAQQLPDAMQMLGKVASATGQDMGFLLDSLVTGVGRVSPMILDNLGIQVSVAEATQRAAEMFGVEADEITKTQQQAGLMSVVMEKLKANTADMPDVAGTAAASFGQFAASMENLKAQVGVSLLPIFTPLLATLSQLATSALPQIVALFQQFAATMSGTLPAAMIAVQDAWNRILIAFGQSPAQLDPMQMALTLLKGALDAIVIGVQLFAVGMQLLASAIEIAVGLWTNLMTILQQTGILDAVATAMKGIQEAFTGFMLVAGPVIGAWQTLLGLGLAGVFNSAATAVNTLAGGLNQLVGAITAVIGGWQSMAGVISSFSIPAILTPGSPTPFELGLRGIGAALKDINKNNSVNVAGGNGGPALAGAGAMAGGGAFTVNIPVYLNGAEIARAMGTASAPSDAQRKMGGQTPL